MEKVIQLAFHGKDISDQVQLDYEVDSTMFRVVIDYAVTFYSVIVSPQVLVCQIQLKD